MNLIFPLALCRFGVGLGTVFNIMASAACSPACPDSACRFSVPALAAASLPALLKCCCECTRAAHLPRLPAPSLPLCPAISSLDGPLPSPSLPACPPGPPACLQALLLVVNVVLSVVQGFTNQKQKKSFDDEDW
jgi:hypothetical protein